MASPPFVESEDSYFLSDVPEHYRCGKCRGVLLDPCLMLCCKTRLCSSCVEVCFRIKPHRVCFNCKKVCFDHVSDPEVKKKIDALPVKCLNYTIGCKWEGELGALKGHLLVGRCGDLTKLKSDREKKKSSTASTSRAPKKTTGTHRKVPSAGLSPQPVANDGARKEVKVEHYPHQSIDRRHCDRRLKTAVRAKVKAELLGECLKSMSNEKDDEPVQSTAAKAIVKAELLGEYLKSMSIEKVGKPVESATKQSANKIALIEAVCKNKSTSIETSREISAEKNLSSHENPVKPIESTSVETSKDEFSDKSKKKSLVNLKPFSGKSSAKNPVTLKKITTEYSSKKSVASRIQEVTAKEATLIKEGNKKGIPVDKDVTTSEAGNKRKGPINKDGTPSEEGNSKGRQETCASNEITLVKSGKVVTPIEVDTKKGRQETSASKGISPVEAGNNKGRQETPARKKAALTVGDNKSRQEASVSEVTPVEAGNSRGRQGSHVSEEATLIVAGHSKGSQETPASKDATPIEAGSHNGGQENSVSKECTLAEADNKRRQEIPASKELTLTDTSNSKGKQEAPASKEVTPMEAARKKFSSFQNAVFTMNIPSPILSAVEIIRLSEEAQYSKMELWEVLMMKTTFKSPNYVLNGAIFHFEVKGSFRANVLTLELYGTPPTRHSTNFSDDIVVIKPKKMTSSTYSSVPFCEFCYCFGLQGLSSMSYPRKKLLSCWTIGVSFDWEHIYVNDNTVVWAVSTLNCQNSELGVDQNSELGVD